MTSTSRLHLVSPLHLVFSEEGEAFYLQLMQHIVMLIEQGHLKPQQKMPGSRVLAESLNVSRSTVVNAYDRLIAEDILYSEPKKGIFVAHKPLLKGLLTDKKQKQQRSDATKFRRHEPAVIRFDSGADPDVFPKQAWLKSLRNSWQSPDPLVLRDDYMTGFPELKSALAAYLYQLRGLNCHADQILITAGNLDALTLISHALARMSPDSEWYAENPSYQPMQAFIQSRQKQVHCLPVDEAGCCLPAGSPISPPVILMTPNRQYPLGMGLESTRRQQWLNLLNEGRCWIIEDDYDNEFNYQRRDCLPLMQSDQSGRTFFVGSFSKILFRGLRLGYIVAPPGLYPELQSSRHILGSSVSLPMQPTVAAFMLGGDFARHMNRMRRHYRRKRDALIQLFEQHLSHWFVWQKPKGGMHVILYLKPHLQLKTGSSILFTDQWIAAQLASQGITLSPLSGYYAVEQADQTIREGFVCGFTGVSVAVMQQIVVALQQLAEQVFHG